MESCNVDEYGVEEHVALSREEKCMCRWQIDRLTRHQVTFNPPQPATTTSITIPLLPTIDSLVPIDVDMHHSPVRGFEMPQSYTDWFTQAFDLGTPVILVYLGPRYRQVLGNLAPNAKVRNSVLKREEEARTKGREGNEASDPTKASTSWSSWLGKVASDVSNLTSSPSSGPTPSSSSTPSSPAPADDRFTRPINPKDYSITFQDGASYLITSTTSLAALHARMPEGELADMTKFRPNIVLEGAGKAWEEDFWGELTFSPQVGNGDVGEEIESGVGSKGVAKLLLNHNCVRCTSLNVDYATGTNTSGTNVLKLLQRDRRVDTAQKWSPVFGRYGWLMRRGEEEEEEEFEVKVGDAVVVTRRNEERSGQKWPGWGGTREDDLWPI